MQKRTGKQDRGNYLEWIEENKQEPKPETEFNETVVPHTPNKKEPDWAYTLREGGIKYPVSLPVTKEQIAKVKAELQKPSHWQRYQASPHGGSREYTILFCFPPFSELRVAEVFLPTGEVWRSTTRKFHKL